MLMLAVMLSSIKTGSRVTPPAREGKARESRDRVVLLRRCMRSPCQSGDGGAK